MILPPPNGFSCLYHVSPEANFLEIDRKGLLVRKAQGKIRAIWLATAEQLHWAFNHVAVHQMTPLVNLNIWACAVPTYTLKKHRTGIYLSTADIPKAYMLIVR